MRPRYITAKRVVQYVAAIFALAAVLLVALLPSSIVVSVTMSRKEVITSATVLEVIGPWFLLVLTVPLILVALPLPASGRAWQPLTIVSAVLLALYTFVGSASIGWYFLPASIAAIIAIFLPNRRAAS